MTYQKNTDRKTDTRHTPAWLVLLFAAFLIAISLLEGWATHIHILHT